MGDGSDQDRRQLACGLRWVILKHRHGTKHVGNARATSPGARLPAAPDKAEVREPIWEPDDAAVNGSWWMLGDNVPAFERRRGSGGRPRTPVRDLRNQTVEQQQGLIVDLLDDGPQGSRWRLCSERPGGPS